jgi:hypothetical protein
VLFAPGQGCAAATQFVGEIPPGRAPFHSHTFDDGVTRTARSPPAAACTSPPGPRTAWRTPARPRCGCWAYSTPAAAPRPRNRPAAELRRDRCDTAVTVAGHAGETGIAPSQVCTQRAAGPRAGRTEHEPVTGGAGQAGRS